MKKRKKNVIYCIAYMVLWVVFRIVMPTRCINKQNRPEGGALLCANHTRTNDPLFIAYALGWHYQIHVMAKEEIMHWPLIGWVLKHGGIFGVKRGKADVAAIKTAMKYLKDGELLLMFPEGTRSKDGKLQRPRSGAALIAMQTGADVLPCAVCYGDRLGFRTKVTICYGELIKNERFGFTPGVHSPRELKDASHLIMDEIVKLMEGLV